MRTKNLFRTLVAACLAVVSVSMFGQVTTSGTYTDTISRLAPPSGVTLDSLDATHQNYIDLVTLNSVMPYFVRQDQNILDLIATDPATFAASEYFWRIVGGGGAIQPLGGVATLPAGGTPAVTAGYLLDSAIQVTWSTIGTKQVWVSEKQRFVTASGMTSTCSAADSFLSVYVMPVPTASFNEAKTGVLAAADYSGTNTADGKLSGCDIAGKVINFAVNVTGTQDFVVNGKVRYTKFGAAMTASPYYRTDAEVKAAFGGTSAFVNDSVLANVGTKKNGTGGTFDGAATSFMTLSGPAAANSTIINAFQFTIPSAGAFQYGKYEVTIHRATDLVSRKSFKDSDANLATGYNNPANMGDLSAGVQTLTVYSFPTPTTGTIRHINNTGW